MTDTYRTKSGRILTDADMEALADEAEKGYDVTHLLPDSGNTLWAWQSQLDDGKWSIMAAYMATEGEARSDDPTAGAKLHVLVDRRRERMESRETRYMVEMHRRRFGQPTRLARFTLNEDTR